MIEAVVQTGSFVTTYRRAGAGGAVLLLLEPTAGDWLFGELAGRFRVIAPVVPELGDDDEVVGAWLRGLIDGLGLERPALVAAGAYGPPVARFAALDPDRVERLALVETGPHDAVGRARVLAGLLDALARQA